MCNFKSLFVQCFHSSVVKVNVLKGEDKVVAFMASFPGVHANDIFVWEESFCGRLTLRVLDKCDQQNKALNVLH